MYYNNCAVILLFHVDSLYRSTGILVTSHGGGRLVVVVNMPCGGLYY